MKRSRILVMAVICVSFFAGLTNARASGPQIFLEQKEYDFGTVKQGTQVTREFKFQNRGDAELVITDIKTSCGCTAAVTSSNTIAPGQEGTLKVTFNSKGRSGPQTKTATVVSNDAENPRVAIRMTGKVEPGKEPRIQVEPMKLDVGVVEPGGSVTRWITIANTGAADMIVEGFSGRNNVSVKGAKAESKDTTIKPQGTLRIEVVATPQNSEGIYQGYLQIRNNSSQRVVTVPVYGYVSDKYMLKPGRRGQAQSSSEK